MTATILYAEDEQGIRQYLQQELQADGYHVILTVDGTDALEALNTNIIDLVIIDEHMPRCNGLETARHIKLMDPTLPIILFTGDREFESCQSPYIDAVIMKHEDLTQLKAEVASLLFDELVPTAVFSPEKIRKLSS